MFRHDPAHGPKIRNTHMDYCGGTTNTKIMRQSDWNGELTFILAEKAKAIARNCPSHGRFGSKKQRKKYDWDEAVWRRLYRIALAVTKAVPLTPAEEPRETLTRLLNSYLKVKKRNNVVSLRRAVSHIYHS